MSVNKVTSPTMRTIAAFVKGNVPAVVWGEPGQAKSAKIEAAGRKSGYWTNTIIGSIRESSDYLGLPMETDGGVTYAPPAWARQANEADKALLIFDELTTTAPSTMKAMLRVLQERFAGDLPLADGVRMLAIANPPETAVDGWDLPAPIANRLGHIEWRFDADEWLTHVTTGFAHTDTTSFDDMVQAGTMVDKARAGGWVTGFLRHRPDLLAPEVPTDPTIAGRAWPSPRAWTNVISVLSEVPADDEEVAALVVKGLVGEGAAKEFFAWLAVSDLADPEAVLADPHCVNWRIERPDRVFAMLASVEALTRFRGDARTWEKAIEVVAVVAECGKPDVAIPAARTLLTSARPKGSKLDVARIREQFSDLMARTERGFAAA